ncbi:MAG: DUF6143 family protein [Eubacteriales bacterium]|nr:DUF6143 family protein [Eubacteriales bacterium]
MLKQPFYVEEKHNMNSFIKENAPKEVVVLSDAVYHSYLGSYFLGQTDMICFGGSYNAWGALVNPKGSNINMFLNAYTISNFSDEPFTAEGWLSSTLPGESRISRNFAAGNQAISPPSLPRVNIMSASNITNNTPIGGVYTFTRRVEPNQTLTKHDFQGMYTIPPGSSFALFFSSPGKEHVQSRMAFGWWEERINHDCRY